MLVSIKLNGKQICSGPAADKSTTIITMTNNFYNPKSAAYQARKLQNTKNVTLINTVREAMHILYGGALEFNLKMLSKFKMLFY